MLILDHSMCEAICGSIIRDMNVANFSIVKRRRDTSKHIWLELSPVNGRKHFELIRGLKAVSLLNDNRQNCNLELLFLVQDRCKNSVSCQRSREEFARAFLAKSGLFHHNFTCFFHSQIKEHAK